MILNFLNQFLRTFMNYCQDKGGKSLPHKNSQDSVEIPFDKEYIHY